MNSCTNNGTLRISTIVGLLHNVGMFKNNTYLYWHTSSIRQPTLEIKVYKHLLKTRIEERIKQSTTFTPEYLLQRKDVNYFINTLNFLCELLNLAR